MISSPRAFFKQKYYRNSQSLRAVFCAVKSATSGSGNWQAEQVAAQDVERGVCRAAANGVAVAVIFALEGARTFAVGEADPNRPDFGFAVGFRTGFTRERKREIGTENPA